MNLKKMTVSVSEERFDKIKDEKNKYSKIFRHQNIEYDESEIISLIERDYVTQYGLPTDSVLKIDIESIEVG